MPYDLLREILEFVLRVALSISFWCTTFLFGPFCYMENNEKVSNLKSKKIVYILCQRFWKYGEFNSQLKNVSSSGNGRILCDKFLAKLLGCVASLSKGFASDG